MTVQVVGGRIHVVAGVLRDTHGRVLLAQRPPGKHLAGLWEFPGGKCEPGEDPVAALRRELHEELGIDFGAADKLIAVPWHYAEKSILLDVYDVTAARSAPHGHEGQALRWVAPHDLIAIDMPAADRPVIAAVRLPRTLAITSEPGDADAFFAALQRTLAAGVSLIQLRAKHLPEEPLRRLAAQAREFVREAGGMLLLNDHIEIVRELDLDGVHLSSAQLTRCTARPLPANRWVSASCHDARELAHAAAIDVDFAVLGPVAPTPSHAHAAPLGWQRFAELCAETTLPVYALGGMHGDDMGSAVAAGAQGLAGISAFWRGT